MTKPLDRAANILIINSHSLLIGIVLLGSFVPTVHLDAATRSTDRPNILLILVDDMGVRDVGPMGRGDIDTPSINLLSRQGMTWTNAYSACPVCSPTRAALMSGKSPARVHFSGHITAIGHHRHPADSRIIPPDDSMDLPLSEVSLAEILKPAGYRSISLGKGHLYEGGIRVPLIIRWPGRIKPASLSDTLTTSEDLFTTISDLVSGAVKGTGLDGMSLVPDFTHASSGESRSLYWYYPHYAPQDNTPGAAIREGNLKLIEFYDPVSVELYDLSSDPGETRNIAVAFPAEAERMKRKLNDWLVESGTILHTLNPDYKAKPGQPDANK